MALEDNPAPLHARFRVGMRAVVRYRVGDKATDALGVITANDAEQVSVATRLHGEVTVPWSRVVVAKEVPPAPRRRGRPHLAIGMDDLEELMVAGHPPLRRQWLGRWLLRSAEGFTGRANSVLPLGDAGMPDERAVDEVAAWYAAQSLPCRFQLFGPSGFAPTDDPLGQLLLRRGWTASGRVLVMTADARAVQAPAAWGQGSAAWGQGSAAWGQGSAAWGQGSAAWGQGSAAWGQGSGEPPAGAAGPMGHGVPPAPPRPEVSVEDHPSEVWWSGVSERDRAHRRTLGAMLEQVRDGVYLSLRPGLPGAAATGAVRIATGSGWAGIFGLHVRPEAREQGLGALLVRAAAAQAQAHGIRLLYLQVSAGNEPAVRLYDRIGFSRHHEYLYLTSPE